MPLPLHRAGLLLALCAILLTTACRTLPEPVDTGHFVPRTLTFQGKPYKYEVFVPAHLQPPGDTPVILFLHGSGERGTDGHEQTTTGLGPYLREHRGDFPAIVVFPQAPKRSSWAGASGDMAMAMLDAASAEFGGSPQRTYLTGISMGGYGTYELGLRFPDRFAALAPVCGGITQPDERERLAVMAVADATDPFAAAARGLRGTPLWIFHGGDDDIVPPRQSRRLAKALRAAGGNVRYTEFPDDNHNAWDSTYHHAALWTWLFAQRRS